MKYLLALAAFLLPSAAMAQPDPQLVEELKLAVEEMRSQLPLKADPVVVTNIVAKGGELVYYMDVPAMDAEAFARFRAELPREACANPGAVEMFRRGGAYTYHLKNPKGQVFTTSVNRC